MWRSPLRWFRKSPPLHSSPHAPSSSPEDRFELVIIAAELIAEFADELRYIDPPYLPDNLASIRGWSIRFTTLPEYIAQIDRHALNSLANELAAPLRIINEYIDRWDKAVAHLDPLLRDYEIMPGDEAAMDSLRVIWQRANNARLLVM